jgi:hypothetical protein
MKVQDLKIKQDIWLHSLQTTFISIISSLHHDNIHIGENDICLFILAERSASYYDMLHWTAYKKTNLFQSMISPNEIKAVQSIFTTQ